MGYDLLMVYILSIFCFIDTDVSLKVTPVCVLPQLAISEHFIVNPHKILIGALSFNFARHRQLKQHAVSISLYCHFD
jgi:hypothetical protein